MKQTNSIFKELLTGLFGLALVGSSPDLVGQSNDGNISGTVYNEVTGRSLQGAVVRVIGTNAVDRTDQEGRFFLSGVPAGSQELSVYYVGLEQSTTTVNVSASQPQVVVVGLSSAIYDLESFIVVPQVVGQERAINQQKTAAGIINIVSEEQFGAMLDGNIGQALQRLPGLSVDEDQDGSQGAINIRGIAGEYNSIQVDGNRIPTSGGDNRAFNPRQLAADGVTNIEVIKAPTPDRDGDAIGGIVNLVTRSAFQRQGREMGLKLAGILNEQPDKWGSSARFSFSDIFSVGGGENNLGVSFTLGRYDTDRYSLNADIDWIQVTPGGDNAYLNLPDDKPVWFLESSHWEYDNRETENYSISGSIDYRIDENNSLYFRPSYTFFQRHGESFETDTDIDTRFQNRDGGRKTYAFLNETSGGGTDPNTNYDFGGSRASFGWIGTVDNDENDLYTLSTGGRHEKDDSLFTWDLFFSKNKFVDTDSTEVNMRTDRSADPNFIINYKIIDIDRGVVEWDIVNDDVMDPRDLSLMDDGELRDSFGHSNEDVIQARIDWEKTFSGDTGVWTLKTGAKFKKSDMFRDLTRDRYDMEVDDYPFASVLNDTGDEMLFGKLRYFEVDIQAAKDLLKNNPELYEFQEERFYIDSNVSDYDATEDTLAAYVMGTYEIGINSFIFGIRREEVEWSNRNKVVSFLDEEGSVMPGHQGSSYAFWLPGVHGRHELKENLILRESYNKSYGRPRLSELSRGRSEDEDGNIQDGNPDLEPAESDNFDIQLEYYTDQGGLFSIGVFYKDISNFSYDRVYEFDVIGSDGIPVEVPGGGDFEYEQPVNGTSATNKGIELIARQQLHFLPGALSGLALSGSATFSDSKANIPNRTDRDDLTLPGFSDKIYTATLDYAWSGFNLRVDWRFRGDYVEGLGSDIESDEYFAEQERIDFEISQRIRPGMFVYITGTNITDDPLVSYQGYRPFVEDTSIPGPKYTVGMEFKF
ncbi:MAG: TonB-dependent receptor [Verrucomicrobia bacterium]|nr:TonB-dependent receptor [Verrucomicrobiota bacterium]